MKKKILLFSSRGGGGHTSAAQAITHHLSDFHIEIVDLGDFFASVDPFYYLSLGYYTGQDIYNVLLKYNQKKIVNFFYYLGCALITVMQGAIKWTLTKHIKVHQPDLIISVIPMINGALSSCAYQLNIPYLLIPTDLELKSFMSDVKKPTEQFTIALGLDLPEITEKLQQVGVTPDNIKVIGFPIRPTFFEYKNCKQLKEKLRVPAHAPVVMLVMGATGSNKTIDYLNSLLTVSVPFHLVICRGRNQALEKKINDIAFPEHITYASVDISYDISDIMAIANLCITKPGTVTFAETLYMNLPVFLDATSGSLLWEHFNITFLHKHKVGNVITHLNQVTTLVSSFLSNKKLQQTLKNNILSIEKKDFGTELQPLINELLTQGT